MVERNWSEHDKQIMNAPTLQQAKDTGAIHAAYGWACSPWGHWTEEQKEAYRQGFKDWKA